MKIKTQFPFIDDEGKIYSDLIKTYAEDDEGNKYYIIQIETNIKYDTAIDLFPCRYTYVATNEKIEEIVEEENNVEKTID